MSPADEARALRRRHDALRDDLDRAPPPPDPGSPSLLVQTVTVSSYPASANAVYGVQRLAVGGTEAEGAAPSFTPVGGTFYATNVGTAVPPPGTKVLATLVGARWEFQWNG